MKKQEPIRILRGNDITLLASLYTRNEVGELNALPLAEMDISVNVNSARRGVQLLKFEVVGTTTLMLFCKADVLNEVGAYSLEIKAENDGQNIRFAQKTAINVVEYAEDVHQEGDCGHPYSVVEIPPQIGCNSCIKFAHFVGQTPSAGGGSGASSEEIAALAEKVADFERELNIIEYFVSAQEKTNENTAQELANIGERINAQAEVMESLQGANEATLADITKLKEDVADIDGEVKEVAEEQEAQGQRLTTTEEKAAANEGKITTLEGGLESHKQEVDNKFIAFATELSPVLNQIHEWLGNLTNTQEQQGIAIEGINTQLQGIDTALTNILGEEV